MTSLTAIFGSSQEQDAGKSEKLLELYWNRAELKKEFANLRDQTFRLREEVKSEKAKTARAQQKIEHLEHLLLDRQWVHSVMVYYQLRALNELCKAQISKFAEQLKQQREKRQHSRLVDEWGARRRQEVLNIERKLNQLQMQSQRLEKKLQAERDGFSTMNGFLRFFRKRSIARTLDSIAEDIANVQRDESELKSALAKARSCEAPDTQGLSIESKRSVNLMIISFAQQLYLHFYDENLAGLAKESGECGVGSLLYGDKADCEYLLEEICSHCETMEAASTCAETLQLRARILSKDAHFRSDENAVPDEDSFATLYDVQDSGIVKKKGVNLLAENYWDLQRVLSR